MSSPYRSSHNINHRSRSSDSSDFAAGRSASTVRPRNRRLISTELRSTGPGARQAPAARDLSPIPSKHPSRIGAGQSSESNERHAGGLVVPAQTVGRSGASTSRSSSPTKLGFGKGLWESGWQGSWGALQELASSVLGENVGEEVIDGEERGLRRNGADAATKRARGNSATAKAPTTWGPSGLKKRGDGIGAGSSEERDTALKTRKTASVLESHDGVNGGLDVNGRYKWRTSLDNLSAPSCKEVEEEDVLVYIHHVQPQDTLAGVVLRYNCPPTVFRKVNRLWPNDAIQIRKVVILPVDACAIRGIPCEPPSENQPINLLRSTEVNESPWEQAAPTSHLRAPSSEQPKSDEDEQAWTHVRWVLPDSSNPSKPIEIARLPRKTLGYFPPRRRKSYTTTSALSTPRGSFDLHAISQNGLGSGTSSEPAHPGTSLSSKPSTGSYFPATPSNLNPRRDNSSESPPRHKWMKGPGGVGTFDKNVRKPGPAQDGLNSWAAKHIPSLAIGYMPSSSAVIRETATFGFTEDLMPIAEGFPNRSGAITPVGQVQGQGQGHSLGLEQAAAAIESWVRRLAIKAPGTPKIRPRGKAIPEMGDLIELLDGAGSDDGRGFEPAGRSSSGPSMGRVGSGSGSGREEHGATTKDQVVSRKGKSD